MNRPMHYNAPNILTLTRIVLIPVSVLLFYLPVAWARYACTAVFLLAALTDWLDGYLARRLNQTSRFGAFLDPVADKLMVAAALVLLVESDPRWMLSIAAVIIIGREITISALREWMAELGARTKVAVSMVGKIKTVAQMTAIVLLLYRAPLFGIDLYAVGLVLLYLAAVLTLWSMLVYLHAAWPSLSSDSD